MMPVAKWTIWQRRWSVIWWSIGIIALVALTLAFYPSLRHQTAQLDKSFNQIPDSAKSLFTDTQDLFSPVGYLSSQLYYLMLPLILSILAIGMGSSLIAREESDTTLELILSRPVSRGKVILQKSIAGLIILCIVGAIAWLSVLAMVKIVGMDVGLVGITVASLYSVVLAGLFGALAFFVASLGRAGRLASIGAAAIVGLLSYIISSLSASVSLLKWPAKILPNHYYHPGDILYGHYTWTPLFVFLAIIVGLGFLSYIVFRRRDLAGN